MALASEGRTELTLAGGGCSCCAAPAHSAPAGGVSTVTVRSTEPVDDATIAAAVAEAGYRVVAR